MKFLPRIQNIFFVVWSQNTISDMPPPKEKEKKGKKEGEKIVCTYPKKKCLQKAESK